MIHVEVSGVFVVCRGGFSSHTPHINIIKSIDPNTNKPSPDKTANITRHYSCLLTVGTNTTL
jgi:hypothetical protein